MTLEDLFRLAFGLVESVPVCKLPPDVCDIMGARTCVASLSADSLKHMIVRHGDMNLAQLCMLPRALQWGLLVRDLKRPTHLISCYQDPYARRRYIAVMKVTLSGQAIWVVTYRRAREAETKRILKNGAKLKNHDRQ